MFTPRKGFGEKEKKFDKKRFAKLLGFSLTIGLLLALLLRSWILFPFIPDTSEMNPAIPKGKRVYIYRWIQPSSLFLGDVVLAEHPTQSGSVILGRIVGKPGDTLSMKEKVLFRNNIPETEGNLPYTISHRDTRNPFPALHSNRDSFSALLIEDRNFFLLCDNRDDCLDSRDFGPIPFEKLVGKVL
ncbi:signal peptidase I [Leptospira broomii serovar Hurstbridge str. 5399]|uniref:Signal peptidase I n=1 Tax=Leptospira broomii serovar Hurstbridge str. 5399 TaxID=1049789 RepID=T0GN36_9LEPT|nr:signal peptidase I [Leptospira broomii]EQA46753.1 signal peptidase I [Leptospira broomii serovar Hurstbridge str. 5399]